MRPDQLFYAVQKAFIEHDGSQWVDEGNYKAVDDGTDYFKVLEKYFQIR